MVIRALHPLDIARFAWGTATTIANRAHTLSDLGQEPNFRLSLPGILGSTMALHTRAYCALTWADARQIVAVAAARPRVGPEAYEIAYLLAGESESVHVDLLRILCQEVAARGGQRVFLRLDAADDLVDLALRCGFIRYQDEVVYKGTHRSRSQDQRMALRRRRASDDYGLFQLYSASTPARNRSMVGVTFSQWMGSRERRQGWRRELVCERDDVIRAWMCVGGRWGAARVEMMVHPDEEQNTGELMESGLARLRRGRTVYALVQQHQILLRRLLEQNGYVPAREFTTMVRSMVVSVAEEQSGSAVSAPSV